MELTGVWDTAARWVTMGLVIALPVSVVRLLVQPLIAMLRRFDFSIVYTILAATVVPICIVIWLEHDAILHVRFGVQLLLLPVGGALIAVGLLLGAAARSELKLPTILRGTMRGTRTVSPRGTQHLVTTGIYAHVRYPRYVQLVLTYLGSALAANTLALYVATALLFPVLGAICLLEERELRQRFGQPFLDYAARVPRFIPWPRQKHPASQPGAGATQ